MPTHEKKKNERRARIKKKQSSDKKSQEDDDILAIAKNAAGATDASSSYTIMTHDEWKKSCTVSIHNYLNQRFADNNNDSDDDETPSNSDDFPANTTMKSKENGSMKKHSTPLSNCPSSIPSISELDPTLKVSSISDIDLQTHAIDQLATLEIIHIDPIRCTSSVQQSLFPQLCEKRTKCTTALLEFPSCTETVVDNGPLFSLYKRVLSVQVVQWYSSSSCGNKTEKSLPMKLYFYNEYAMAMNDFLNDNLEKQKQQFLALNNIPSCCILPSSTTTDPMHPFCIAIGGPSKAYQKDQQLSFDSPSLRMVLVRLDDTTTAAASYTCAQYPTLEDQTTNTIHMDEKITPEEELYQRIMQLKKKGKQQSSSPSSTSSSLSPNKKKRSAASSPTTTAIIPNQSRPRRNKRLKVSSLLSSSADRDVAVNNNTVDSSFVSTATAATNDDGVTAIEGYQQLNAIKDVFTEQQLQSQPQQQQKQNQSVSRRRRRRQHEQQKSDITINVVGVIWGFCSPSRFTNHSTTSKWTMSVELMDPTTSAVIQVTIHRPSRADFPTIDQVGNLMVLEDAGIIHRKDNNREILQLVGRSTTKVQVISSVNNTLVHGKNNSTYSGQQWKFMTQLWKWGQDTFAARHHSDPIATNSNRRRVTLQELPQQHSTHHDEEDGFSNTELTGMVCAILPFNKSAFIGPFGYVRLWDGTGAPIPDALPTMTTTSSSITPEKASDDSEDEGDAGGGDDLPTEAWKTLEETVTALNRYNNGCDILLEQDVLALTGRVVNVAVWELAHWDYIQKHCSVGTFVHLRNVQHQQQQQQQHPTTTKTRSKTHKHDHLQQIALQIHAKTWMYALPSQAFEIRELLQNHERRIHRHEKKKKKTQSSSSDTLSPSTNVNTSSLSESLETLRNERNQYRKMVQELTAQINQNSNVREEDEEKEILRAELETCKRESQQLIQNLKIDMEKLQVSLNKQMKNKEPPAIESVRKERGEYSTKTNELQLELERTQSAATKEAKNAHHAKELKDFKNLIAKLERDNQNLRLELSEALASPSTTDKTGATLSTLNGDHDSNAKQPASVVAEGDKEDESGHGSTTKQPTASAEGDDGEDENNTALTAVDQTKSQPSKGSVQYGNRDHDTIDDAVLTENQIMDHKNNSSLGNSVDENTLMDITKASIDSSINAGEKDEETSPLEKNQDTIQLTDELPTARLEAENTGLISGLNSVVAGAEGQTDEVPNDNIQATSPVVDTKGSINDDDEDGIHSNESCDERLPRKYDIVLGCGVRKFSKHQGNIWYYERTQALVDEWLTSQQSNLSGKVQKLNPEKERMANSIIDEATKIGGSFLRCDENKNLHKLQSKSEILNEVISRMIRLSRQRNNNNNSPKRRRRRSCRMENTGMVPGDKAFTSSKALHDEAESKDNSKTPPQSISVESPQVVNEHIDLVCQHPTTRNNTPNKAQISSSKLIEKSDTDQSSTTKPRNDTPMDDEATTTSNGEKAAFGSSSDNDIPMNDEATTTSDGEKVAFGSSSNNDITTDDEATTTSDGEKVAFASSSGVVSNHEGDFGKKCLPGSASAIDALIRNNSALIAAKTNELIQSDGVVPTQNKFSSSNAPPAPYHPIAPPIRNLTFPETIFSLLSTRIYNNAICWHPNGTSFVINRMLFTANILPNFFEGINSFESFIQQLSNWGFEKISKDYFAYSHRLFQRDYPQFCGAIRYTHTNHTNAHHQQSQLQNLLLQRHLLATSGMKGINSDGSFGRATTNVFEQEQFGANRPFFNHTFSNSANYTCLNGTLTGANMIPRTCQPYNEEKEVRL